MQKQKQPFFTGRDGLAQQIKHKHEMAAHARPVLTSMLSGACGLLVGGALFGAIGFGAGYSHSEWTNSDEFRIQQEKIWKSERTERESQRAEDVEIEAANVAKQEIENAKTAADEAKHAEQTAAKNKITKEKNALLAKENAKTQKENKEKSAKQKIVLDKRIEKLSTLMFERTTLENAFCNAYSFEIIARFSARDALEQNSSTLNSLSSKTFIKRTKAILLNSCKKDFPKRKFLAARNLSEKMSERHYEQLRDMMALCDGVKNYKKEHTLYRGNALVLKFNLLSNNSYISSKEEYKTYQTCMAKTLDHPLIKTHSPSKKP